MKLYQKIKFWRFGICKNLDFMDLAYLFLNFEFELFWLFGICKDLQVCLEQVFLDI